MAEKHDRNALCHCGSGKKYKNCCMGKDESAFSSKVGVAGLLVGIILGLILVGYALSDRSSTPECPPGTVWSESHQHCH